MNFQEAEQALRELTTRRQKGEITAEVYTAEINKIRVLDAKSTWWQPDPRGSGWLSWNGKEWVPGIPPAPGTAPRQAPAKPAEYTFRPVGDDEPGYNLMSIQEFIAIARTRPWKNRPRKWWDLFSILTGVTLALAWFVYTCLNPRSEGWDLLTPFLMIAIPLFLVSFRKPIDEILMPLQPHRAKLPHLLLLGLGICIPFLMAWILLNILNIREYSLIRANMLAGTCIAYAVTRDPVLAAGFRRKTPSVKVPLALLLFLTVVIRIVRGDDCMRDPLNGNDCLRTPGYGEGMAGGASAAEAGANAAGDEASDPGYQKALQDDLDKMEPGEWYKFGAGWAMIDENGIVHVYVSGDGSAPPGAGTDGTSTPGTTPGDSSTPSDRTPPGQSESTTVNPDGSTTTTIITADGKTITTTTSADGKTVSTTMPNGEVSVTTTNPDGTKTTTTTGTDGQVTTTTRDPRTGVTTTTDPDGKVTTEYPGGKSVTTETGPDGTKYETWNDGTTVTTYPDHTTVTTTTWPDGTKTTTTQNPDGTTETTTTPPPDKTTGDGSPSTPGDGDGETGGFGGEDPGK